jgi:endonuclease YncB( thermonuclease family)
MNGAMPPALLVAALVFQASAPPAPDLVGKRFSAHVIQVVDGDTVRVRTAPARVVEIRLFGIDTPERGESFSDSATRFTRVLMFDKDVVLTGHEIDKYSRLVARIQVDGKDASALVLSAGLGCHYRKYSTDPSLEAAELAARRAGHGFWAPGAKQPACVAREANAGAVVATSLIGNVSSRVFHLSTCRNAHCKNCTRNFVTREEAEKAGFRPAGDCIHR